jgi:hypothetical protein
MGFSNASDTSLFGHAFMEMTESCISGGATWMFVMFIGLYANEMVSASLSGLFRTLGFSPIGNM